MGGRQSSPAAGTSRLSASNSPAHMFAAPSASADDDGAGRVRVGIADVRPRSLSNVLQSSNAAAASSSNGHHHNHQYHHHAHSHHHTHLQPSLMSMAGLSFGLSSGSPDSDTSAEDMPAFGRVFAAHSLPLQPFVPFNGIKCPVCSKTILTDDVECHLVMCLTKPRISYNEDVLTEQKGECVICLDDMNQGDMIARLPCLCIYHKRCIDDWFQVNRSCPEHPAD